MTTTDAAQGAVLASATILAAWVWNPNVFNDVWRFLKVWKARLHLRYLLLRHRKALRLGAETEEKIRQQRLARLRKLVDFADAIDPINEQVGAQQLDVAEYRAEADGKRVA